MNLTAAATEAARRDASLATALSVRASVEPDPAEESDYQKVAASLVHTDAPTSPSRSTRHDQSTDQQHEGDDARHADHGSEHAARHHVTRSTGSPAAALRRGTPFEPEADRVSQNGTDEQRDDPAVVLRRDPSGAIRVSAASASPTDGARSTETVAATEARGADAGRVAGPIDATTTTPTPEPPGGVTLLQAKGTDSSVADPSPSSPAPAPVTPTATEASTSPAATLSPLAGQTPAPLPTSTPTPTTPTPTAATEAPTAISTAPNAGAGSTPASPPSPGRPSPSSAQAGPTAASATSANPTAAATASASAEAPASAPAPTSTQGSTGRGTTHGVGATSTAAATKATPDLDPTSAKPDHPDAKADSVAALAPPAPSTSTVADTHATGEVGLVPVGTAEPTGATGSSAPAAAPAPPAPTTPTELPAAWAVPTTAHTMTVQVAPHGLGNVTAHIDAHGSQVTVSVTADNEAGREALRDSLPTLAEHLRTGDGQPVTVSLGSATTADSGSGPRQGSADSGASPSARPAAPNGSPTSAAPSDEPGARTHLDRRTPTDRLLDISL